METFRARHLRGPRLKPLAGCLALAFSLGASSLAPASEIKAFDPARPAPLAALLPATGSGDTAPWRPSRAPWRAVSDDGRRLHPPLPHVPVERPETTILVENCNDTGDGSLRDALVNVAQSGDTIDLSQLTCSTITLTSGAIFFGQNDITLIGPDDGGLVIDGDGYSSLRHTGTGTFELDNIVMVDGAKYLDDTVNIDARGGCVYSAGFVSMSNSYLKYCHARTTNTSYRAEGGAVWAASGVTMSNTGIFLSSAGNPGENGVSGGVHSPGSVILLDSEVSSNSSAQFAGGVGTFEGIISKYSTIANNDTGNGGGGVYSLGNAIFQNSTIEGNTAGGFGGGAILYGNGTATTTLTMTNSTVSGNTAAKGAGLMFADYAAQIGSSTIAFNVETGATKYGAGVYSKSDVALESTIVGANSIDSGGTLVADDIGGPAPVVFSGHSNLVTYVVGGQVMPADTLYENPELAALANNGGLTRTHMLLPNSPAIDAGNNEVGAASDQRGSGFPRVINGRADIGAVEFSDVIFANGFD